jgi:hypothetical protein
MNDDLRKSVSNNEGRINQVLNSQSRVETRMADIVYFLETLKLVRSLV